MNKKGGNALSFWDIFWGKEVNFIVNLICSVNVLYYYSLSIYRILNKEKYNSLNTFSKKDFSKNRAYCYFIYAFLAISVYIRDFGMNYIYISIIAITIIVIIMAFILFKKIEIAN